MAQQAAVTEYSKLEGTHKDHWVQLLMKWPVMDGTIPKISKCMFSIDEKMHISSHRARKSQSKSNLLCQKTKPKPPKTTNREQILWKADGLTLSKLWAACTHHSLWEHIPKEQALLHVGCYWLKWFRETFFFFSSLFFIPPIVPCVLVLFMQSRPFTLNHDPAPAPLNIWALCCLLVGRGAQGWVSNWQKSHAELWDSPLPPLNWIKMCFCDFFFLPEALLLLQQYH